MYKMSNGVLVELTAAEIEEHNASQTAAQVLAMPGVSAVRAEASRRMQVLFGARDAAHLDILISNAQREATRLQAIRLGVPGVIPARDWTGVESARAAELIVADAAIEAIRVASNALEANPPADYASDHRWP